MDVMSSLIVAGLALSLFIAFWPRRKGAAGSPTGEIHTSADLFALLNAFLDVVGETLWSASDGQRRLDSETEKYRCLYFTFGAIKRLAESVRDQQLGNQFAGVASVHEAAHWFGQDRAMDVIRDYGNRVNIPDDEVATPAQAGHSLMSRFLKGNASDSFDGYSALRNELLLVVRRASSEKERTKDLTGTRRVEGGDLGRTFESFLEILGVSRTQRRETAVPKTDEQKRRYLYFILGSSLRLAQSALNDEDAGQFYRSIASQQATGLFGEKQGGHEVLAHLQYLANPGSAPQCFVSTLERGHAAMEDYLNGIEGLRPDSVAHIIRTKFLEVAFDADANITTS
jgi:hypothetical protein